MVALPLVRAGTAAAVLLLASSITTASAAAGGSGVRLARRQTQPTYCEFTGSTVKYFLATGSGFSTDCDTLKADIGAACGRDASQIDCGARGPNNEWTYITFVPPQDGDRDCGRDAIRSLSPDRQIDAPSCYNF